MDFIWWLSLGLALGYFLGIGMDRLVIGYRKRREFERISTEQHLHRLQDEINQLKKKGGTV